MEVWEEKGGGEGGRVNEESEGKCGRRGKGEVGGE